MGNAAWYFGSYALKTSWAFWHSFLLVPGKYLLTEFGLFWLCMPIVALLINHTKQHLRLLIAGGISLYQRLASFGIYILVHALNSLTFCFYTIIIGYMLGILIQKEGNLYTRVRKEL